MLIAVIRESHPQESRVAISPDTVARFRALNLEVRVQSGAGERSGFSDPALEKAGARIEADGEALLGQADIVLAVRAPDAKQCEAIKRGASLIGMLSPHDHPEAMQAWAAAGIDAFAMELMPRISRAQSMDVLSSQSNLAGYKAVIDAVALFHRAIPMMMTAAGTVPAARIFVLGAGVAGLQAIATARRLGAIVSATDVRPAVKEQVESLGASFVMVDDEESKGAETSGGYAKEMSEDYRRRQAELVANHLKKQDIVITTALIPGRPAPTLIGEEMVQGMAPGSVIVDMAVEQGGNCPLSRPGEIVDHHGVRIVGYTNMPGRLPVDASALYARNLFNFLSPFVDKEKGSVQFDSEDELVIGTALTREGKIVHPLFQRGS
ncbi:MAG: Re/Si-specific NAD(P)(+) transhydrogenase subunit alpha [Ectothiorhodospiraceae bacterium AqS1]|nr:Re/Si-specific NAD(P)(+) transhydrogenase subunit alpha [Ectothiorhodospiraceae bacterium AqS1]